VVWLRKIGYAWLEGSQNEYTMPIHKLSCRNMWKIYCPLKSATNNSYLHEKDGETEELVVRERRTFTVVGFYERPGFEPFIAPGYTALTVEDNNAFSSYDYDVYIKTKKMSGKISRTW